VEDGFDTERSAFEPAVRLHLDLLLSCQQAVENRAIFPRYRENSVNRVAGANEVDGCSGGL
jgi:hypothetical protein